MLYFCFGIDLLSNNKNEVFINRYIKTGESGFFEINKKNINIFLNMLKIFGILSKNHKYEILEILKLI